MELVRASRHLVLAALCAGLASVALAPAAEARVAVGGAVAVSPATAARTSLEPAPSDRMEIVFPRRTATVAGPGALVRVRCAGTVAPACVGTLTVMTPGEPATVPFSVEPGLERVVVVPLGDSHDIFDGGIGLRTRVSAETLQPEGGALRTARMLRFR